MLEHRQYTHTLGRGRQFAFLLMCMAVLLSFLAPTPANAQPTGYQEYYVLGYEEHIWRAFLAINDNPDPEDLQAGNICSTVSLVATAHYQVVYYDHWEDGYEADLLNPIQPTTKVYGDKDISNGGAGDDILLAGDDISLTSDQGIGGPAAITASIPVSPTRNSAYIRYDGGDRIVTSGGPVNLTHAMWPLTESWIGGAWEVYSRQAYADTYSYHLPIGEDLYVYGGGNTGIYGDFRDVYLQLEAFEDNTTISISSNTTVVNLTLDRGQTYSSMGYINSTPAPAITVNSGTVVHSSKPTQVGLVTGADGAFQGRFLIVLPDQEWGADYVVPVPRGVGLGNSDGRQDAPAEVYLSNPNDFPIEIQAYDAVTHTSFFISPTGSISATVPYSQKRGGYVPQDSAARFTSSDGVFGIVICADTSGIDYDWGFSGMPAKYLARDYYIPWAPGTTDLSDNGSPVWVTPLADDTTFYVDYSPLDGTVDETFTLDVLAQHRISDTIDNDNTGMHVWATGEFAIAWGEDPRSAWASNPYLDMGVTVLPLQQRWLDQVLTLDKTADPTILPPTGGTVTFTLVTQSHSAPLVNVDITDTLPINWTYVPGSALVTYENGSPESQTPTINGRTLFWDLSTDLDIDQTLTLTFQAQITDTSGISVSVNHGEAIGKHEYSDALFNPTDDATIYISPLVLAKSVNKAQAKIGETLVYTLSYANRSDSVTVTDVVLRDVVPIQHATFNSASDGGIYSPASSTVTWALGALAPGDNGLVTLSVTVNDFVEDGAVIENVGYINSHETATAGSNAARTWVLSPDVKFAKSGPTVAELGQVITYTLSYENVGGAQATQVTISDTIPLSTTYVPGSLAINTGSGWVPLTDAPDGDQGVYVAPALVITPGTVGAGEAGQIRFSVEIDESLTPGSLILNSATLDRSLDIPRYSNLVVTRILDLLIGKTAAQEAVVPGGVISYTLTYENASETTNQAQVYVREPIPDYTSLIPGTVYGGDSVEYSWDHGATWTTTLPVTVTHIRWYDADLPPNTRVPVGFAVRVNDTLPPNTTIKNMAHISSTETAAYLGWIPSNQVEVTTVDLWVEKSTNQSTARAGDLISYTISYGNHGSANVPGVQIIDTLPASTAYSVGSIWGTGANDSGSPILVWDVMTVTDGASTQMVGYTVLLDSNFPNGGIVTNTAVISSAYGVEESNPVTTTVTTWADLAITKSAAPPTAVAGETLTYTIVYTNVGPSVAHAVRITDTLPVSVTYGGISSSSLPTPIEAGRLLTWYTPTLAAGEWGAVVLTVTVDARARGAVTNNVVITSSTYDPTPPNNEVEEQTLIEPDLAATKTALDLNGPLLYPGDEIEYRVVVTNTHATLGQSHLVVSDSVPVSTTLVAGSATCSPGAACNESSDAVTATAGNLGPGDVITLTFRVTVDSGAGGRVITNQAYVTSDQQTIPVQTAPTTNTVTTLMPALTLIKWADPNASTWSDTWTQYHFQVTNTGDVTLTGIQIWDDQLGPKVGLFSVPDLAVGEGYLVTQWWPVSGDTYNVATATAQVPGFPDLVQATDDAYFDVIQGLSLVLEVSPQPEAIPTAQVVSYTYVLTNVSNDWLEAGTITDTVYGDIATGLSLPPGESYTHLLTRTVSTTTVNVAYAWGTDRLGSPATATDSATVTVGMRSTLYLPLIVRNY